MLMYLTRTLRFFTGFRRGLPSLATVFETQ